VHGGSLVRDAFLADLTMRGHWGYFDESTYIVLCQKALSKFRFYFVDDFFMEGNDANY
jgi:hypothetical protein